MRTGFIGLGIMGSRMARNLLDGGYDLTIHNRTASKAEDLLARGAKWAATPSDLASRVDVLFTMLPTPEVVQNLAAAENGFLGALPQGALWVDCSTVDPGFARWMAGVAADSGVRHLDAPVAGTKGPAENGELVFFVGGKAEDLEEARPLLACMGKAILPMGEAGQGAAMKMLVNLMLGSAMAAYSEALVLGEALGFAKATIAETILSSPVAAPFLQLKQGLIERNDFKAHFPLRWMRKDLHLAARTAYECNVALPALNSVKEIYALAEQHGLGEEDFAAIYRFFSQ